MTEFCGSEWEDLTPIPQYEGEDPVVQIAYPEECKFLNIIFAVPSLFCHIDSGTSLVVTQMGLFRALIAKQEYSKRGFELTTSLLELNAASFTVWQYRRECIRKLHLNLTEELDFMDTFASENPKNYQIWYHRRAIVELLGKCDRELPFTAEVFNVDSKNYHAWAHRQWAIQTFSLWDGELQYVEECINEDIRNNSAWNQRWFVVHRGGAGGVGAGGKEDGVVTAEILAREIDYVWQKILAREIDYVWQSIFTVKKNESSWNYLRGLIRFHPEIKKPMMEKIEEFLEEPSHHSHLSLGLLADLYEAQGDKASLQRAKELLCMLMESDVVRVKTWARRLDTVRKMMEGL
eukprot:gene34765-42099_t